jgi:sulfate/thiosulfate transport system permease protein
MSSVAGGNAAAQAPPRSAWVEPGAPPRGPAALGRGMVVLYLSVIVLLPLAAVASKAFSDGLGAFWTQVTSPEAVAALKLTLISAAIVVAINVVTGTMLAWVLVRDEFPGKRLINSVIDLPFALPTIVASVTLLSLYGTDSPLGIHIAFTRGSVALALLFVTLPFVVRAVQPTLLELDREMEDAAASLGAKPLTIFRRIVLPNLAPAILAGAALAFARAIGEYGSLVLLTGQIPFKTEASSVFIFNQIQSDNPVGAAASSVVLIGIAVAVLLLIGLFARRAVRHGL